jgi:membrane protease YdiL (CAAX protease family)
MKASKRYIFQIILWLVIWLIIWYFEGDSNSFIEANYTAFIAQIVLLGILIYYAAPKLLFKKKYLVFFGFIICLISLSSLINSNIFSQPNFDHTIPPGEMNSEGMRPGEMRPGEMRPEGMESGRRDYENDDHAPMLRPLPPNAAGPSPFFIHLLLLTMAVAIGTFLETLIFAQKKEEETIKNINEKLATELKLLKSQINPHFLFNTLNNIYALSAINTQKTQESISYLADMLRYVLYECDQPEVSLTKEINYIENYIKLFAVKSTKKYPITTNFIIEDTSVKIAPMLLIPFLENALKHGNIEQIKDAFLSIDITQKDKKIIFKIVNSKSEKIVSKDNVGGIGLENVKKRLRILYPEKHEFFIEDNKTSYSISLKLFL